MSFVKRGNLPELLAPAGSLEHLKAAVSAGADAIYMGGEKFGARAYAQNFSREDMIEALQIAHFHERKLYLTVNTLMKEEELFEELGEFLFPYYENGLDGVIVQDMGAARFIREHFPGDTWKHTDDSNRYSWSCCGKKNGNDQSCACKRTIFRGDKGNKRKDRTGYRSFCSWSIMLLLFRTVSFK